MAGRGRGGRGERLQELLQMQQEESRQLLRPVQEAPNAGVAPRAAPDFDPVLRSFGRGRGQFVEAQNLAPRSSVSPPPSVAATAQSVSHAEVTRPPCVGRGRMLRILAEQHVVPPTCGPSQSEEHSEPPTHRPSLSSGDGHHISELSTRMESMDLVPRAKRMSVPENPPEIHRGTAGREIPMTANYIRLQSDQSKGMFEYYVRFTPDLDNIRVKRDLVSSLVNVIGETRTFDGSTLYLPHQLNNEVTTLHATSKYDPNSNVMVTITYQRKRTLYECVHFYNILFNRIMDMLNFIRFGRNNYDPAESRQIPQHRLEVWPGYVTAVDEYEGGIMLCCDVSSRVLRFVTAYQIIQDILSANPANYQQEVMAALVGKTVMTNYNKKLYRIDDIDFEKTPRETFMRSGKEISYAEYYQSSYGAHITDFRQPLLIHKVKKLHQTQEVEQLISLIPEFCQMTGFTDEIKSDFKVMKEINTVTRLTPNQRQYALNKFINRVNKNPDVRGLLEKWGLTLQDGTISLTGRVLEKEKIRFGNYVFEGSHEADWGRQSTNQHMLTVVALNNWAIITTRRDTRTASDFFSTLKQVGPQMGQPVSSPHVETINDDRVNSYIAALKKVINPQLQIVVIIFPTQRDDRYAAVKKFCLAENPCSSQVINARTINNPKKIRSVTQKIALQMNCKMGGTLWSVVIPFKNTMICGLDSYHDPVRRGNSWVGFIASMNPQQTRWYSQTVQQVQGQELVDALKITVANCLKAYHEVNGTFPDTVFIYRDGVGDGQLKTCEQHEIPQLMGAFKCVSSTYNPKFCFIVVQKRINTRIFTSMGSSDGSLDNVPPGSVMDHTVTRRNNFDFFIVSQHVRQGTVSPTHYVVLHDSTNWGPDRIQKVTYKMCHMYYNWAGTIRVPAPCQYAHKLAYLVGQNVKKVPNVVLNDKLYFL